MLRTIRIYGALARFLKRRVFRAQVANAAEAIRFLLANFPELQSHMAEQYYEVRVGSRALQVGSDPGELHLPTGQKEVISIIPVMAGAGGAAGKIAIGIALIAAAIVFAPAAAGFLGLGMAAGGTAFTLGAAASVVIGGIGASLALGGIAQLLSPTPKVQKLGTDTEIDPRKSYSFSGVQNTSRQGVSVSIVYGEMIVGSVVVSAGVSTEKVTA
jgi:predicted phage tail protein